jgi:hypothetical protein
LEVLAGKPGARPGSVPLAQARRDGVFTSVHDAFWAAARVRHGDSAGTRVLIEVLLHRRIRIARSLHGRSQQLGQVQRNTIGQLGDLGPAAEAVGQH